MEVGVGYSSWHFLVWANDMGEAIDELGDYCAEHAPGLLNDKDEMIAEYNSNMEKGMSEEGAWNEATMDMIQCGNDGMCFFNSWEVNAVEDPSRKMLKELTKE
jgi:hypothetical protein